jgi:hypothetical protein
VCM